MVCHGLSVLRVGLLTSRRPAPHLLQRSGFCLAMLPSGPDWWLASEVVVLLEGSPLSAEELWSSDSVTMGLLVTSLTEALLT